MADWVVLVSKDQGETDGNTWNRTVILRDDAGTASTLWPGHQIRGGCSNVGYPITVQFAASSLFTCYWITMADGIAHTAATRWRIDEV